MNNEKCIAAVAKQQSVLENELDLLTREINALYRLSDGIYDTIGPSHPKSNGTRCDSLSVGTVATSLRNIRAMAEETKEQFECIAKILKEHLGELKLEN